jgi:4-hydroxythreonine-4-phosphate dehydrogenase
VTAGRRPRLAVALGDPRGIGPEVVAKALSSAPLEADVVVIGADEQIAGIPAIAKLGVGSWEPGTGNRASGLATHPEISRVAGRIAAQSIRKAVTLALTHEVDAVVTGPVNKAALHAAGVRHPGVTELLGELTGGLESVMMLVAGALRVVLVTTHLPLRDVPAALTGERVERVGRIAADGLRRWWGLTAPRLAVCAVNPHAGEGGLFGDEDDRVLAPAARALGAAGPLPADTVFVRAMRGEFDAVLAPYHDVGMTAVKVAGFGKGVNVTLGLPFIRTSPDHGTAFEIAGQDRAEAGSMRAALEMAASLQGSSRR